MRVIRPMTLPELEQVLTWAAAEGWNPGLDDAAAFHASDPAGFLLAEVAGAPVAAISVVNHSEDMAFLGLYLCRPDWRGQGHGWALWQAGLAHAGGRTIGLDGVAAQEANYAKSGFLRQGATVRWEGFLPAAPTVSAPDLRPYTEADLPALTALDAAAQGYARPAFLRAWLAAAPSRHTWVRADGQGFVTARACSQGVKIGPVIAPDAVSAHAMIAAAAAGFPGPVIVDIPEQNTELASLLAREGMVETFRTARMYQGVAPESGPLAQAIATMELG
jgi:GNAT superfamily N-acetyltransferase